MPRPILALLLLLTLASCGADGMPTAPGAAPGASVTGEVSLGMTGASS
jgi:predicted small lipoprotein YifL